MSRRWLTEEAVAEHQRRMQGARAEHTAPSKPASKPRKYRNEPTVVDGVRFDSKHEAACWRKRVAWQQAGAIRNLRRQVRFAQIGPRGELLSTFIADFVYETVGGQFVVEDAKSDATRKLPAYRAKVRWMAAVHGITVQEV